MSLALTPPASGIIPAIHSKELHMRRERNRIISNRVCGASSPFKNAHPFGYDCVCMCVSSCAHAPARVCVSAPGVGGELKKISCPMEGDFERFLSLLSPLLISSSRSSRTFQLLLSALSAGRWNETSPACRKSGWSQAEGGLDLTGGQAVVTPSRASHGIREDIWWTKLKKPNQQVEENGKRCMARGKK